MGKPCLQSRPGGPAPKISPARKGWVHSHAVERRRCGTTLFVSASATTTNSAERLPARPGQQPAVHPQPVQQQVGLPSVHSAEPPPERPRAQPQQTVTAPRSPAKQPY